MAKQPAGSKKPKIVRANINRQNVRSEMFATFYANDAQFETTPWDIRATFGEISGISSDPDPVVMVTELFEVRMSLQFAKHMASVLFNQIRVYEQTIGLVPEPANE